jgi:hypothetical protein
MWILRGRCHGLLSTGTTQALGVVSDNLVTDFVEADCDVPVGIVRFELPQVRNVADVVADAVLMNIMSSSSSRRSSVQP